MDYNMPILDGLECLKHIKNDLLLSHIPVIILSTASDSNTQKKMIAAGATAFVTKPDSFTKLVGVLCFYLVKANTLNSA
jgi:CheY-like chemotaxis protein